MKRITKVFLTLNGHLKLQERENMKNGVCSSYNMKNGECFHLDVFIIVLSFCWVLHPYFRVAPETLVSGYLSQKNDRSEILLPCIDSL